MHHFHNSNATDLAANFHARVDISHYISKVKLGNSDSGKNILPTLIFWNAYPIWGL